QQAPVGGAGYFDTVTLPSPVEEQEVVTGPIVTAPVVDNSATDAAVNDPVAEEGGPEVELAMGSTGVEVDQNAITTDTGSLDLNVKSQEQQKIERDEAAQLLAEARENLVIIEPGQAPELIANVNIALFARETTNALGEKAYKRPLIKTRFSFAECDKFDTLDNAQRYFLANGGPEEDPLNLDPDGDGFACDWSPEFYRRLK
ncbi:MAG TPA: hypothetical protein VLA51_06060, partial [Paracoccaceae bacterium]|nr:hypothetical protein [Paracoccaceae bacterium]